MTDLNKIRSELEVTDEPIDSRESTHEPHHNLLHKALVWIRKLAREVVEARSGLEEDKRAVRRGEFSLQQRPRSTQDDSLDHF